MRSTRTWLPLLLLTPCLIAAGCWLEPVNPPHTVDDNAFSKVWEGTYEGYGNLTVNLSGNTGDQDVRLLIHDANHNTVTFDLYLVPARDLAPLLDAEGVVRDTVHCQINDLRGNTYHLVDIVRRNGKIYGGIQVLDLEQRPLWKLEALNLLPVDKR